MNRLATIEAFRMSAVVDESLDSLRMLALMLPSQTSDVANLDPLLEVQQANEHRFRTVYSEMKRMGANGGKDLDLASLNLRQSTREVCRAARTRPNLKKKISEYCEEGVSPDTIALVETLSKLKDLVATKLCTTVEQQDSVEKHTAKLALTAKTAEKDVEELEISLRLQKSQRAKATAHNGEIISKLASELASINAKTEAASKELEAQTKREREQHLQDHERNVKAYEEEIAKLKEQLANQRKEHTAKEDQLRKKKTKLETEVSNWIAKYDTDMGERNDEIENIQKQYDEELEKLRELGEFFAKVDHDLANKAEEDAEAEAERQRLRDAMTRLGHAAALIQALARGVQTREGMKKGKGKKKKKGGGKKKKK